MGLLWEDVEVVILWVKDNGDNNAGLIKDLGEEGIGEVIFVMYEGDPKTMTLFFDDNGGP